MPHSGDSLSHLIPALPGLIWALPFAGTFRLARRSPDVRDFPVADPVPVSVIIPARNETATIDHLLDTVLTSRHQPLEVIVVDDRSTDDTAAKVTARLHSDPRLQLIHGADLPSGWLGKPWACAQGASNATGSILVFTDAEGAPYHLTEATRGKVALVFFGYTNCPDICPVHLANIAAVLGKLPDEVQRDVTVIFITTDPARDSLPRLRQWVRQFDRRFVGLTGPDSVIVAAERALGVIPAVADSSRANREYLVQHAGQVIVADGTAEAARRLERVLTNDPAMGVFRHVDAGYELAQRCAGERGVDVPM